MTPIAALAMFDIVPGMFAGQSSSPLEILMLQAGAEGVTLATADGSRNGEGGEGGEIQHHVFAPGWAGLVMLDRIACEVQNGGGVAYLVEIAALTKLQAFLDAAQAAAQRPDNAAANSAPLLVAAGFPNTLDVRNWSEIERWFLALSLRAGAGKGNDSDNHNHNDNHSDAGTDFSYLAAVLRSTEYYQLVRFLLSQPASRSMHELSAEYGLSYSHFRKLCRAALGRGGKAEFQYWRNVRALLDMVDHGGSLTDVALRQGFASSSHFSDAMKGQFGIAPRYLTRALTADKP